EQLWHGDPSRIAAARRRLTVATDGRPRHIPPGDICPHSLNGGPRGGPRVPVATPYAPRPYHRARGIARRARLGAGPARGARARRTGCGTGGGRSRGSSAVAG